MSAGSLADRLRRRIERAGPMSVSEWIEATLYDLDEGFYMTGGRAGRRGDFLTAPEIGPLFGSVLARAIDDWWVELGRPDPFPVFEVGAGPGTLARGVLRADSEVARSGALCWRAVEISPVQRDLHPTHSLFRSAATLDDAVSSVWADGAAPGRGVVLANELLDNLPFDVLQLTDNGWREILVIADADGRFQTVVGGPVPEIEADLGLVAPEVRPGVWIPWQSTARKWIDSALAAVPGGLVVVFDYGGSTQELSERSGGWLRVHRDHSGDRSWLEDPGAVDITSDVAFDQVQLDHRAFLVQTQSEFLRAHGLDELVETGRRVWRERAGIGDLEALEARSRIREAEALCEPDGMGSFVAAEWRS